MADLASTDGRRTPAEAPWGRTTLAVHLALFAVPAVVAWTSSLNATVLLPMGALLATLAGGLLMLARARSRSVGVRVTVATLAAAAVEAGATLALVAAYSSQHPGWDLA